MIKRSGLERKKTVRKMRAEEARRRQKKGINITWREEEGTAYTTISL